MTCLELKCKLANYVDVTFQGPTDGLAAQALLRHIFPKTDCCVVDMKVLDDGLSNQLVLLTCDKKPSGHSCARKSLLVRIYGLVTNSLIDRTMELLCMTAFHAHGGMPKVYAVFNNGIAYSFIPGRTLPPTDLGSPKYWRLIASELAQFHCLLVRDPLIQAYGKVSAAPGPQDCVTFPRLYAWISLLKTKSGTNGFCEHRLPSISDLLHEVDEMASILQHASTPIVLCHNDLLAGNIIISPDEKSVHFIDLEYSGFARAAADIGNHFCEYAGVDHPDYTNYPSLPFQRDWMRCYLQHVRDFQTHSPPPDSAPVNGDQVLANGDTSPLFLEDDPISTTVEIDRWLREVNYFALVAHLTWSIWAAVRSCDDEHKFNFSAYSMTRINEYHRMKKIILATFVEGQKAPEDFVIP
ncbi:Ethanolamine kinase 1 [Clonorchis sinensis]|uniref:ethanolamine kinase n=2 Tax=Clonorchis sinensis TaxID=79923 RepID=A0A8T1LUX6_CLOSI|nr:Ethanolamine kinase 1 [Clonorchis sinensis]